MGTSTDVSARMANLWWRLFRRSFSAKETVRCGVREAASRTSPITLVDGREEAYQSLFVLGLHRLDDFAHGEERGGRAAEAQASSPSTTIWILAWTTMLLCWGRSALQRTAPNISLNRTRSLRCNIDGDTDKCHLIPSGSCSVRGARSPRQRSLTDQKLNQQPLLAGLLYSRQTCETRDIERGTSFWLVAVRLVG